MGLIDLASGNSLWRGYDYYKKGNVIDFKILDTNIYISTVKGSENSLYDVKIDLLHPRKSTCNCPLANGKRIICKHMVATYFAIFPNEAEKLYNNAIKYEEEESERQDRIADKLSDTIYCMSKTELQEALLSLLFSGPDWQYNKFVNDYVDIYDID